MKILEGRRGFGTIDMLLALCIAALIATGIFFFYKSGETTARTQELTRILNKAQQNIRNWHIMEGSAYTAVTTKSLLWERNWFDRSLWTGSEIRNPWGGIITYGIADEGKTFTLEVSDIPDDACMNLARQSWDAAGITLNNKTEHTSFPIAAQTIINECRTSGGMASKFKIRSY